MEGSSHSSITQVVHVSCWIREPETPEMIQNFILPFINSTLVVSAWHEERLVGVVRVLSDKIIRSIIYDLVVDPEYQSKGI